MAITAIRLAVVLTIAMTLAGCGYRGAALPSGAAQGPDKAGVATPTARPTPLPPGLTPMAAEANGDSAEAMSGPPRPGLLAADFTLKSLEGTGVTLSDLRGQAVIISFWATWCGYCKAQIPTMVQAYDERRDEGLEILGVNLHEPEQQVDEFAETMGMNFPILLDSEGSVAAQYYVRGIPTSVFIDQDGVITDVHVGMLSEDALDQYLATLLR